MRGGRARAGVKGCQMQHTRGHNSRVSNSLARAKMDLGTLSMLGPTRSRSRGPAQSQAGRTSRSPAGCPSNRHRTGPLHTIPHIPQHEQTGVPSRGALLDQGGREAQASCDTKREQVCTRASQHSARKVARRARVELPKSAVVVDKVVRAAMGHLRVREKVGHGWKSRAHRNLRTAVRRCTDTPGHISTCTKDDEPMKT